jgi:isoleucyl-tRNA synthetase
LYDVFVLTAKVIAPFMPHQAEVMSQNLVRNVYPDAPLSVHMTDWPLIDESLVDKDLEAYMEMVRSIVESASNARQKVGRKLRWPVSRIVLSPENQQAADAVMDLKSVLMDQTNSKDIVLTGIGESWDELGFEVNPDPGAIGPVFKGDAGKVIGAIKQADATELKTALALEGEFELEIPGGKVTIKPEMVNFTEALPEMVASAMSSAGVIYVDAKLTREIEAEGFAREVIRRVQDMRKELDLAVDDNIKSHIQINEQRVLDLVLDHEQFIAKETRSDVQVIGLDVDTSGSLEKDWNVEGISMKIGISKVN